MRVAILETVKTDGGFEQEFDRLIIDTLEKAGHEPVLYLPERSHLPVDFGIPVVPMKGGEIVDYEGAGLLKKLWLSLQRERRRVRWFDAAYEKAAAGEVDAILLTTATWRYLRSLHKSKLRHSPVPVIFIFLGVNPKEKPHFIRQASRASAYPNIHLKVTTLRDDFKEEHLPNVDLIPPLVMLPTDVARVTPAAPHEPLRIGFFGHYRKGEKDVDGIIEAFLRAGEGSHAKLVVQAAPTAPEDAEEMDRIMAKYAGAASVEFIRGTVLGKAWYDLLQSVDVLFLPYSDPRYLYNWSALYFTALALHKPVLTTPVLNPEILASYQVGREVDLGDLDKLSGQIADFLATYEGMLPTYERDMERANRDFSPDAFLKNILS